MVRNIEVRLPTLAAYARAIGDAAARSQKTARKHIASALREAFAAFGANFNWIDGVMSELPLLGYGGSAATVIAILTSAKITDAPWLVSVAINTGLLCFVFCTGHWASAYFRNVLGKNALATVTMLGAVVISVILFFIIAAPFFREDTKPKSVADTPAASSSPNFAPVMSRVTALFPSVEYGPPDGSRAQVTVHLRLFNPHKKPIRVQVEGLASVERVAKTDAEEVRQMTALRDQVNRLAIIGDEGVHILQPSNGNDAAVANIMIPGPTISGNAWRRIVQGERYVYYYALALTKDSDGTEASIPFYALYDGYKFIEVPIATKL